jgi:hypothetical protein
MNAQVSAAAAAAPRFIKIGEDGALLPADATSYWSHQSGPSRSVIRAFGFFLKGNIKCRLH